MILASNMVEKSSNHLVGRLNYFDAKDDDNSTAVRRRQTMWTEISYGLSFLSFLNLDGISKSRNI